MPCLIPIIAVFFPRVILILIALFTHWITEAFPSLLWPVLGFFLMPYTTLIYIAAMLNNDHSVTGIWLILLIIAVIFDLGTHGGSTRRWRRTRAGR